MGLVHSTNKIKFAKNFSICLFDIYINLFINISMSTDKVKILAIQSTHSKILDTLCSELSITQPDQNSSSLLEILQWRIKNQITKSEFHQLYKDWLNVRNIKNILTTRLKRTVQKSQLLEVRNINRQFLTKANVLKCLEILNEQYNKQFLKHSSKQKLEMIQTIFSYLDKSGNIHLRFSEIIFMYFALIYIKNKPFPIRENFRKRLYDFMKEIDCSITGIWSLRNFKNYLYLVCEVQDLDKMIKFFKWYAPKISVDPLLPNLFEQAILNWQSSSRFDSDNRIKDIYKRIFQENDILFFTVYYPSFNPHERISQIYNQYENMYGCKNLETFRIDFQVVQQFYELCQKVMQNHIDKFFSFYQPNQRNDSLNKKKKKSFIKNRKQIYWNPEYVETIKKKENNKQNRNNKFNRSFEETFFSRLSKGLNISQTIKNYIQSLSKQKSNTKKYFLTPNKPKSKPKAQTSIPKEPITIVDNIKEFQNMNVTPFQTAMKILKNI